MTATAHVRRSGGDTFQAEVDEALAEHAATIRRLHIERDRARDRLNRVLMALVRRNPEATRRLLDDLRAGR